jgi:phosphatidylglycerophosphate synthase
MVTCLAAVVAAAAAARSFLPLGASYAAKAGGLFLVVLLVAVRHAGAHHPFARFGAANHVTAARAALVALVTALIGEPPVPSIAGGIVSLSVVALLMDGADGWLARRTRMASAFGARFDVEIDALLIQALAILAWWHGKAGAWVLLSGLLRYAFVAAGWLWVWMRRPLAPSWRARAICVVQIVALIVAMAPAVTPPASAPIAAASLALLAYSFAVDTMRLWRGRVQTSDNL